MKVCILGKPQKALLNPAEFPGLSSTFGTPYETEKDRAKREIMECMPRLITGDDEVIVVDPEKDLLELGSVSGAGEKE